MCQTYASHKSMSELLRRLSDITVIKADYADWSDLDPSGLEFVQVL